MITHESDLAALCAAVDDGDDDALSVLADWLEERGHDTTRLRRAIEGSKSPQACAGRHWWLRDGFASANRLDCLDRADYLALAHDVPAERPKTEAYPDVRPYSSRSRAFLALVLPTL